MGGVICPHCRGGRLRKAGKAVAGYVKVQLYHCGTCNRLLAEGEVVKRPVCPRCHRPMRINNFGGGNRFVGFKVQFKCSRCNYTITLGGFKHIREERSPRCPVCGGKYMVKKGTYTSA